MINFKETVLVLCLFFSGALCNANGVARTEKETKEERGTPIEVIKKAVYGSTDKSESIALSIDGHVLSVVFLEDLGQVTIDVSFASGGEVEASAIHTPNGVNFYIPNTGSYIVTFTLSNGDVYYGEFEVTD